MKVVKTISLRAWPRATIADRLSKSYGSRVHVTLHAEFSVRNLKEFKEGLEAVVQSKYSVRLTYTALFTKLVAHVLRKHLIFNSIVEGDEVKVIDNINIAVAVQSEKLGLVTPVIRDVDVRTLGEVARELNDLVVKAREGKLSIRDLSEGTFTISNLGMLGSVDAFTQIINPPQVAILGIGRVVDKPTVINGEVRICPMCTFSLTFDHRVIDGYHGAEFLATLREFLEKPDGVVGDAI